MADCMADCIADGRRSVDVTPFLSLCRLQVKQRLMELQSQPGSTPEVVVVGGGYAGIELASTAAEMLAGVPKSNTEMI